MFSSIQPSASASALASAKSRNAVSVIHCKLVVRNEIRIYRLEWDFDIESSYFIKAVMLLDTIPWEALYVADSKTG